MVIDNTNGEKIKIYLNSTELTQDGTPTPESSVNVNVITGDNNIKISNSDNTEEQKYPITLSSKNLFNLTENDFNNGETLGAGKKITLTLKPNTNYTLSSNAPGSSSETNIWFNGGSSAINGVFNGTSKTSSTDSNGNIYISIRTNQISNIFANYWIQLEEGSTVTDYTPYFNPIEYCKIGDYRDQIFKNTTDSEFYDSTLLENEWYLKKNIGKVVLDGTENWSYVSGTHPRFTMPKSDIALQEFNVNAPNIAISDYFKSSNWYSVYSFASVNNAICSHNSNHVINIKSTQFTNVNDFKTWLSTHNTKVYYVQTTPTYIHISESDYPILRSQLENLYNNAISYVGTTNITQTNDDLPFTIDYELIEIPKDLKGVLNDINEFLRVNL